MKEEAAVRAAGHMAVGGDLRAVEHCQDRAERSALGRALLDRSGDIQGICQSKYFEQSEGMSWESITRNPMWEITSVAVTAIATWLQTGDVAGETERDQIASLGHVAAKQEAVLPTRVARSARSVDGRSRPDVTTGALSVTLLTKLNLWWRDATCLVLVEEATRLGISAAIVREATEMVVASCNSSMVRMAKSFDAELQDLHEQLTYLLLHDPLTGLANRAVLLAQLERAIGRLERHAGGLAVAFIDLDNFKRVNDAHGHASGDELLIAMAARFASRIRPGDTIARFGGDEFVALFEDLSTPFDDARALARRLHHASAEPVDIDCEHLSVTASIGVAVVAGAECRAEDVIASADTTMYSVKRAGRNQVEVVQVGE